MNVYVNRHYQYHKRIRYGKIYKFAAFDNRLRHLYLDYAV